MRRRWGYGFGIGTVFSLIIVYFIYLFARDKYNATQEIGWAVLKFVTKWYLLISLGILALFVLAIIIGIISMAIVYLNAWLQIRKMKRKRHDKVIDADYKIKE